MDVYDLLRIGISGLAGTFVAPAILAAWSKLSPPKEVSMDDDFSFEELVSRNSRINSVASALSVSGIILALPFYFVLGIPENSPWTVGLGFGLMVILPVTYISLVTYPVGAERFREFWRFYELNYDISIRSLTVLYVLLSLLGVVSAYELIFDV